LTFSDPFATIKIKMEINMIIWRIIGIILVGVGNITRRSDVLFLGYYLTGTGNTHSLPEYLYDGIITTLNQPFLRNKYSIINLGDVGHLLNVEDSEYSMLYNTVGKFWAKRDRNYIYIKDTYEFYPLCEDANTHFKNCKCTHKEYSQLRKHVGRIPRIIVDKFSILTATPIKLGALEIELFFGNLTICVNDKFWVDKGKPFEVYSEIVYNKI
jgi:hypothetical protein